MTGRDENPDDEFFAPVLREPPPGGSGARQEPGPVSDTGVPGVHGAGRGDWAKEPPPRNSLSYRLLAAGLVLLAGVVLAVWALLAGHPALAIGPAVVALAAAVYLVAFGVRRARSDGGPPTFG
ncbi:hypothetical protein MF672_008295 [Actinomadura sp. ATCC 31491]|uniref:DUF3040 domain-containing protein n=1 Tax=Actinomadura luzonensis TaxID=2805427 RepID=A0ABT0FNB1_9ACTN|nr:hypothetical protein [Actinomadura luzonensis]MCK2213787.1 hypothetical protein [Actinomadura luzonensis]